MKRLPDGLRMITVVYQNCDLGNVHGFDFEISNIEREHFNQSLVVSNIGFSTVSKEGKSQCIDRQMTFDPIGCLVMTKPFRGNAGIAGVLNCLGINDD